VVAGRPEPSHLGAQLFEGLGEASEVLPAGIRAHVEVPVQFGGAVQPGAHTADQDVVDLVPVEDFDDARLLERRRIGVTHPSPR